MGGIAALEQKFGIADNGNSSDLGKAYALTYNLLATNCTCGFHLHGNSFGRASEELKAKQEQAVASEIERYYRKAKEILALNHELLDAIALGLSQKGVLTAADIAEIKKNCTIVAVNI